MITQQCLEHLQLHTRGREWLRHGDTLHSDLLYRLCTSPHCSTSAPSHHSAVTELGLLQQPVACHLAHSLLLHAALYFSVRLAASAAASSTTCCRLLSTGCPQVFEVQQQLLRLGRLLEGQPEAAAGSRQVRPQPCSCCVPRPADVLQGGAAPLTAAATGKVSGGCILS